MKITLKAYLDTRRMEGDKPVNMMILLSRGGKSAMIPVGIKIAPSQWDKNTGSVRKCPQKAFFDKAIYDRFYQIQEIIKELSETDDEYLRMQTIVQVKNIIREHLDGKDEEKKGEASFASCFGKYIGNKEGRTKDIYKTTWKRIGEFTKDAAGLDFEDVNVEWLRNFDMFLMRTSPSQNARNIHFRNIRAVFNYAIDNEMTMLYPFRKFKMKTVPTAKRSLPVEDIRMIATMPLMEWQELHRDIFMLDFYLIGINLVDLFKLTRENVQNGRIVYTRSKTKKVYSIKIEPEAMEILDRHRGVDHLLDVADRYKNYLDFTVKFNRALKTFGEWEYDSQHRVVYHPKWDGLSSYWARHSWATIAYNDCDIPVDVISQALGHSMGNSKVTMVYINTDSKKVDRANRKVMDFVLGKEERG